MQNLIEDVELSFKLFEFSVRTMCYAELDKIDVESFGNDLQLNLPEENVSFPTGDFLDSENVIRFSQMSVGTAFGATAICLDCLLENSSTEDPNLQSIKSLVGAIRNAFSHGIAMPCWYIKKHKYEKIDLAFVNGPVIDLEELNGKVFYYQQIGGLALWYRIKEYAIKNT